MKAILLMMMCAGVCYAEPPREFIPIGGWGPDGKPASPFGPPRDPGPPAKPPAKEPEKIAARPKPPKDLISALIGGPSVLAEWTEKNVPERRYGTVTINPKIPAIRPAIVKSKK